MGRIRFSVYSLIAILIAVVACSEEAPQTVSLDSQARAVQQSPAPARTIHMAVGGMITPKEGMTYYREFLNYVQDKLGIKVDYVDRQDYGEINEMLRNQQLEAAFVCSGPYVDGHAEFGLELLAAPQAYGRTVYHSYIIVPTGSSARSLADLRGKRFAFTDPLSNTGKLVPTYMLSRMKETPESFFGSSVFTSAHDLSIKSVAQGLVDGAAVDSLIWDYLNATSPDYTSKTSIIAKSPPYGIPPLVVPKTLDPKLKEQLRDVFLNAHNDPRGKEILKKMMIDRFVPAADSDYDSIREMKTWLSSAEKSGTKKK